VKAVTFHLKTNDSKIALREWNNRNVSSRVIEKFDLGTRLSGEYKFAINGSKLDAGLYIFQVWLNEEVYSGKMIKK